MLGVPVPGDPVPATLVTGKLSHRASSHVPVSHAPCAIYQAIRISAFVASLVGIVNVKVPAVMV